MGREQLGKLLPTRDQGPELKALILVGALPFHATSHQPVGALPFHATTNPPVGAQPPARLGSRTVEKKSSLQTKPTAGLVTSESHCPLLSFSTSLLLHFPVHRTLREVRSEEIERSCHASDRRPWRSSCRRVHRCPGMTFPRCRCPTVPASGADPARSRR